MTLERKKIRFSSPLFRNFLLFLLAFAIVLATQQAKFGVQAVTSSAESKNKYLSVLEGENFRTDTENTEDGVDELIETYNLEVNDIFNERIRKMVELGNSNEQADIDKFIGAITPPKPVIENGAAINREKCAGTEGGYLSTYCLALDVTKEYFLYREAMIEARNKASNDAVQRIKKITNLPADPSNPASAPPILYEQRNIFGALGDELTGQKTIQDIRGMLNRIDIELDAARKSLDQTLAAYSELQIALPLHQKYLKVIRALQKYRDKVSDVRREIDLYPTTFLDVTTPSCL